MKNGLSKNAYVTIKLQRLMAAISLYRTLEVDDLFLSREHSLSLTLKNIISSLFLSLSLTVSLSLSLFLKNTLSLILFPGTWGLTIYTKTLDLDLYVYTHNCFYVL